MPEPIVIAMQVGNVMIVTGCAGISTILWPFAIAAPTTSKALVRYSFAIFIALVATYHLMTLLHIAFAWAATALAGIKLLTGAFCLWAWIIYRRTH